MKKIEPKPIEVARREVKDFVSTFDDQKLAEVLAFAEDGKMDHMNTCCCIRGVFSSTNLHVEYCSEPGHYARLDAYEAEDGYFWLDGYNGVYKESQELRDREFIAILKQVMAEREAKREATSTTVDAPVELAV
jgi:hypothetical protein